MVRKGLLMLLAGVLVMGLASFAMAQEGGAKPEGARPAEGAKPEAKAKRPTKIERALSEVNLTDEQKAKIDPILAEYANKRKAAAKDIAQQNKLIEETCAQITPLLTEEQKPKFDAAMKAKRGGKKEKKEGEAAK